MFNSNPKARTVLKVGTLYAMSGDSGWIYYGQVSPDKSIGFFQRRDRDLAPPKDILSSPIMSTVGVVYPSIGRALRSGRWKMLGRFPLHEELEKTRFAVQWPLGALRVTVWAGDKPAYDTDVRDPGIQQMEVIAAWDAEHHLPARLAADFGDPYDEREIGGPVWRERRERERLGLLYVPPLSTE